MKILSITAQKPHSTGSGTYMTELVNAWNRSGCTQSVVAGIYKSDSVYFPENVNFYPVFFSEDSRKPNAVPSGKCSQVQASFFSTEHSDSNCDIPFPIAGMSDVMPYPSTRYRDLTCEMKDCFGRAFIKAVECAVHDLDPDIIVCHHLFLLTAIVREHFPDRKIYGVCHGTDLRQMLNCDNLRDYVRPGICGLDGIFALHDAQAADISDIFGIDRNRITVIGSGYNDRVFNTIGRTQYETGMPVRICYAGKMSRPKGVPELLEVLGELEADESVPEFSVVLAGGCQDSAVQDMLDNASDCFRWLGQIPQSELARVFKSGDIFVLPSYFEGLNLAVIEAMSCGLIPVCTDLPGMQAWINSNVPDSNVLFIPKPEMASVDLPTEAGRTHFMNDLRNVLRELINGIASGKQNTLPDTSTITWDSVAAKISDFS